MTITPGTLPTLMDIARITEDGQIAAVIELLADTNEILQDIPWEEANDGTSHKTTVRTGIPAPTWRKLNYGVIPTKSQTAQVTDATGMIEAYAEQDKDLVDMSANPARFRLSEDTAHIEGMSQEVASTLFYGDPTLNNAKFMGFTPRYDTPSTDDTKSGYNILDGGGTGNDNTSVWLVGWGPRAAHGIYPKGLSAGVAVSDKGQVTLQDPNGGHFEGYRTHYKWNVGLSVRDWRHNVRICNIDVSNLVSGAGATDLVRAMVRASERPPENASGTVRRYFYVNKTVRTFLRLQILDKGNVNLTFETVEGRKVMMFDEIMVRRCDALINAEAQVTGTFANE